MDLAVRREFPIYERLKLQFRAEAFNLFNHPNFGFINPNFGEATFGQATSTLNSSLGVLSPLYQTGGPRSMQFALKLIFRTGFASTLCSLRVPCPYWAML
jgi:hypothetical protein